MDQTKSNGIRSDTETSPFLGNSFGEADNSCFGGGIICLSDVTVQTAGRGNVDDGSVFALVRLSI